MYINALKELVYMSNTVGNRVDYVQAGGGNTSVKFEDGYMAIKASGYLLKEMTDSIGFVVVNGREMKYYHETKHDSCHDCNKEAMEIALASIKQVNGEKVARPSIEVGFHSILGKYVLHLHPVYVNVLMCSRDGVERATNIIKNAGISCIAIPYAMPGYHLTKLILDAVRDYRKIHAAAPQVVLLKNHGVVTHADTARKAIKLMDAINDAIVDTLNLPAFPIPTIEKDDGRFKSTNAWMKKILAESDISTQLCLSPIYPDQLVYITSELSIGDGENKIVINGGDVLYNTSEREAIAFEETMTALVYLYHCIQIRGLKLEILNQAACNDILGWDSEKYRKSLVTEQK